MRQCKEIKDAKSTAKANSQEDRNLSVQKNCLGKFLNVTKTLHSKLEYAEQTIATLKTSIKRMEIGLSELISEGRSSFIEWNYVRNRKELCFRLFYRDESKIVGVTDFCIHFGIVRCLCWLFKKL